MISSSIILDVDRLAKEVEYFGNQGEFFFDVETIPSEPGLDDRGVPSRNVVTWMGMATHKRVIKIPMGHLLGNEVVGEGIEPRLCADGKTRNYKVPLYSRPPEQIPRNIVFEMINPLFADPNILQAAAGATFDGAAVAKYRPSPFTGKPLVPEGPLVCTHEMFHLVDENRLRYGLKYTTKDIYGFTYDDASVGKTVEKFRMNVVAQYLHYDLVYGWQEYKRLKPLIIDAGLEDLWMNLEVPLTTVLADMRTTGVAMDEERLEALRGELSVLVGERERKFYSVAGKKVNLRSAPQMQALLFGSEKDGGLGLPAWKLTDSARKRAEETRKQGKKFLASFKDYSTDDEALDGFRDNPVVGALMEYRETNKVYSTYVIGYLGDSDAKDKPCRVFNGRIYPDFVQYGAGTGRFSCREPNLQNVPTPASELGRMVRGLFIPAHGNVLIVADYGQIELVLLAHFIGYGALYDGFLAGIDPHTMTAAMALNLDPRELQDRVTAEDKEAKGFRQRFGKSINFATVYGAWIKKLASMMSVSMDEAEVFKNRYDNNTPEIDGYRQQVLKEARRHSLRKTGFPPHTKTLMGRIRRLPELMSSNQKIRNRAERQIFNAKIQGSSADLTKMAMVRFYKVKKEHWTINLTVHDELVIECPIEEQEEARAALIWAMTGDGIQDLVSLPLKIDVHTVKRWSDAK